MHNRLPLELVKDCTTDKQKEDVEALFRNNRRLLATMEKALLRRVESLHQEEIRPEEFDNPAWATKAAYRLGQVRALQDVIKLLNWEK